MPYDPALHDRRSIRLHGYDYSQPGAYFITICAHQRACLFGEIKDGEMHLNDIGLMVESIWLGIPDHYAGVGIDAHVVMPNHFHGILLLMEEAKGAGITSSSGAGTGARPCGRARRLSLPEVIQRFKSLTTHRYGRRLWQRNYYERVVRSDQELLEIRKYIAHNPPQWALDHENLNRADGRAE